MLLIPILLLSGLTLLQTKSAGSARAFCFFDLFNLTYAVTQSPFNSPDTD